MKVRDGGRARIRAFAPAHHLHDINAELGAAPLYLLTNRRCAAAIHLYEKLGFAHDAEIMAAYGARYARCDVAMRYMPR